VVSFGGENLKYFLEKAGKSATCTSRDAVIDFVETSSQGIEENFRKRLHQVEYFSFKQMSALIFQQLKISSHLLGRKCGAFH